MNMMQHDATCEDKTSPCTQCTLSQSQRMPSMRTWTLLATDEQEDELGPSGQPSWRSLSRAVSLEQGEVDEAGDALRLDSEDDRFNARTKYSQYPVTTERSSHFPVSFLIACFLCFALGWIAVGFIASPSKGQVNSSFDLSVKIADRGFLLKSRL